MLNRHPGMLKTENLWPQARVGQILNNNKMKKLGKLNLMKEKMLSHEELVSFRGGSGGGTCGYVVNGQIACCISYNEAHFYYDGNEGPGNNWCCDSCSTTWYCGNAGC